VDKILDVPSVEGSSARSSLATSSPPLEAETSKKAELIVATPAPTNAPTASAAVPGIQPMLGVVPRSSGQSRPLQKALTMAQQARSTTRVNTWTPRKRAINKLEKLTQAAEAKLETVPRMSSDYVEVMMHLGKMDVLSVKKLRNEEVVMAFVIAVSGVPGEPKIVKVLHGTNVDAIDAIVREGFKVGGEEVEVRNGSALGKGVYLTTTPETAVQYSLQCKCNYLLLCELCVDKNCNTKSTGIYVQPDKALVRPLYVRPHRRLLSSTFINTTKSVHVQTASSGVSMAKI